MAAGLSQKRQNARLTQIDRTIVDEAERYGLLLPPQRLLR